MPERDTNNERPQERQGDRRVVVQAQASARCRHRTMLGQVSPLGIAEFAKRGMDLAQVTLELVEIEKLRVLARMRANAAEGGARHVAAEIVQNQLADGRVGF